MLISRGGGGSSISTTSNNSRDSRQRNDSDSASASASTLLFNDIANEWEYVAEGGANVIFHPSNRSRSRSKKSSSNSDPNSNSSKYDDCVLRVPKSSQLCSYVDVLEYAQHSILPIMNNRHKSISTCSHNTTTTSNNNCNNNNNEGRSEIMAMVEDNDDNDSPTPKYKLYGAIVTSSSSSSSSLFLKELNDKLQSTDCRPINRRGSTLAIENTTQLMILPNVIKRGQRQERGQQQRQEQICTIEIKPKSGLRPSSSTAAATTTNSNSNSNSNKKGLRYNPSISNYGLMKQSTCRYCMHQEYKLHCVCTIPLLEKRHTNISYCPMDLFSNSKFRMKKAIRSLLEIPQNNLQILLPPPQHKDDEDEEKEDKDDDDNNSNGKGNGQDSSRCQDQKIERTTTPTTRTKTTTEAIQKIVKDINNTIQTKNELIDIIIEGLYQSDVLNDIKRVQELDIFDIEGIWVLQQLLDSCESADDVVNGSEVIPKKYLFVVDNDTTTTTTTNGDDNGSSVDYLKQKQQQQQERYQLFCYRRRLLLIQAMGCNAETSTLNEIRSSYKRVKTNFLLSTTMKDCSILLSIRQRRRRNDEEENDDNGCWRHEMEYQIECNNSNSSQIYYVLVSIIDLDIKPSSKIPKYYTLDQQIINYYCATYGLHHKLCYSDGSSSSNSNSSSSSLLLQVEQQQKQKIRFDDEIVRIKGNMMCRLLYPNPVCLLTVYDPQTTNTKNQQGAHHRHLMNVMTITWLTPIDNSGTFVCSINKKRYTSELLNVSSIFVLNIPSRDMEHTILRIGSCSGRDVDKFQQFGLQLCCPGWSSSSIPVVRRRGDDDERGSFCVSKYAVVLSDCIAHTICTVQEKQDQGQHWLFVCKQQMSWSRKVYFEDGKRFRRNCESLPPYLTFLGSQTFGSVVSSSSDENR